MAPLTDFETAGINPRAAIWATNRKVVFVVSRRNVSCACEQALVVSNWQLRSDVDSFEGSETKNLVSHSYTWTRSNGGKRWEVVALFSFQKDPFPECVP